jgi:gliding motility-associated-like protein
MRSILLSLIFFVFIHLNFAQQVSFVTKKDVFGNRNFVENKGQFNGETTKGGQVLFGYQNEGENIYFTNSGLIYKFIKRAQLSPEKMERAIERGFPIDLKADKVDVVHMNWINCNYGIVLTSKEKQGHYMSYGAKEFNSACFKKLLYENVYKNIDIEYILPEDKEVGIKYNVILHPGANISDVKIRYTGDCDEMKLTKKGEVEIKTPLSKIIEHAPISFYSNNTELKTKFILENNILSFEIPGGYDQTQEVKIDPWVSAITSLSTTNVGFDVDYDYAGNLYMYGGSSPFKVSKYNVGGALQWTFQGIVTVVTPTWSTANSNYCGNLAVNRVNGKLYIGNPFENMSGTRIVRIDNMGNYDNFITAPTSNFVECWEMSYQCANNRVCAFGGYINGDIVVLNDPTSNTITTYYSSTGDVNCVTFDNAGELFMHFTTNQIKRVDATFNTVLWSTASTFTHLGYWNERVLYAGGGNPSQGFNCLAVNNNYLYFYDGFNLTARDKNTGSMIAAITLPTHTPKQQGGIEVDECDNVYIGGNGNIITYYFNGTNFVNPGSINLNAPTSLKFVYDIRMNKSTKMLYVCGSGFAGVYSAPNSFTCAANANCLAAIAPINTVICYGTNAYLTCGNPNNLANPSYSIQPGSTVQASPVFTVSPSANTNYTMFITGTDASSAIVTQTAAANVTVVPSPVVNPTITNGTCANPVTSSVNLNVSFTPSASANYTVIWSPVPGTVTTVNSGTAAGLVPGVNNVTVVTANGCSTTATFTVPPIPQPASFVIVNPSNDYTVTCLNPNVVLTTSITNGVPLSFTWFPTCTNTLVGTTMSFNQACTGQVVGTSSTGCLFTQTFVIYQDATTPTIVITPTVNNITCSGGSGCFTLTSNLGPNVTTNWFQVIGTNTSYVGAAQGTINVFCAGSPGIYWGESVNNLTGCRTTKSVEVTASVGVPQFTVTSPTNFTIGCGSKSVTSMQVTSVITSPVLSVPVKFAFMTPPVTATPAASAFQNNPNLNNITIPGTYVIYVRDESNLCISSQSISIIQNTIAPNINFIQPLSLLTCRDPSMVLTGISSNTNTNITWTVPAIPSNSVNPMPNATLVINPAIANSGNSITVLGTWTVGAVDNNNFCAASKTVMILQDIRIPTFSISALTNSVINCKNADVVIVPITSAQTASLLVPTYVWYPPVGGGVPGSQFNSTAAGTHTSISTSVINGCTAQATYIVGSDFAPPALDPLTPSFTLDCATVPSTVIKPVITGPTTGFTYSWTIIPAGAITSAITGSALTTNQTGIYMVSVTNTINGCKSTAVYQVVEGAIRADFTANPDYGFAPLNVTFNNTSATSTSASSIISTWGYGNGAITPTVYNNVPGFATYTASGTYSVILTVRKGTCIDTAMRIVKVELPSKLEIPNVFTPNGDKSNDVFKLRASNLKEIYVIIYDRWGTKVYEVTSETGNFAWDGKAQTGKECAAGTYFYILKAKGTDGQEYDMKGNVSLFR